MKTLQVPDPETLIPLLDKAQLADANDAVAHVDLVPMSDAAQLSQLSQSSKSILSKFLLTVALFTPVAASGIAPCGHHHA